MTFSASLRLNTKEFKKGISDVQKSLKGLQNSFLSVAGALGLGLSLNRLGSNLLDTATKLSVAQNTLQNVSKEIGEYGQSLAWLDKISMKYGQDMITLTNSFAQFRAAASNSKLTLDQMRDIYEALTRAAGAYHLSADRTNDVMMAVTQMISKSKVVSEELRRQLSNNLPGAFNLMAQAAYNAGIITENSTAALEDAMKKGKVAADQVLPAFAKVLNDVTANADFDSLQTSINRMKNTFTQLVDEARFENIYKGIVDNATSALNWLKGDFWPKVLAGFAGVFGGTVLRKGVKKGFGQLRTSIDAETNAMIAQFERFRLSTRNAAKSIQNDYGKLIQSFDRGVAIRRRGGLGVDLSSIAGLDDADIALNHMDVLNAAKAVKEYNQNLLEYSDLQKKLYGRGVLRDEDITKIKTTNKELDGLLDRFRGGRREVNKFAGVTNALTNIWKGFAAAVKSALASLAVGAIIAGITYLVAKLVEARKEAKRIAGIVDDMKKAVEETSAAENETVIKLTQIKTALQKIDDATPANFKQDLINNVNKLLGRTGENLLTIKSDITDEVIPAIDEYIKKITEAARQQAILAQISSATSRIIQLGVENEVMQKDPNYGKKEHYQTGSIYSPIGGAVSQTELLTTEAQKLQGKIDKNNDEIDQLNKGIDALKQMASEETLKALTGGDTSDNTDNGGGGGGGKDKNTPSAVLADYKKDLKELENQFHAGAILAADYEEKLKKLNSKAFEDLAAFGWEKVQKELKTDGAVLESIKAAAQKALLEGLSDPNAVDEFDKEMEEAADKALKDFQASWDRYLQYVKQRPVATKVESDDYLTKSNKTKKGQTYSERETYLNTQVYDATKKDIDNLENFKKSLEEALKTEADPKNIQRIKDLLDNIIDRMEVLKTSATDLKTKIDIASIEKDITDLKEKSIDGIFSSITTISNGMDNLYRAYQSIQQLNDSTWKSEELEKFLTGLNSVIQLLEVIKGVYTAVNAVIKISDAIKEKSAAKAILLNKKEAKAEVEKGIAAGGAAGAEGASSVAGIPVVGPALAVAAVAAIVAAIMAGMSKFATGGIVGGNSYSGDKQVARVNSGEMILNKQQQANLLAIANGKSVGGGEVTFKIRGTDLIGAINNEMSRRRG